MLYFDLHKKKGENSVVVYVKPVACGMNSVSGVYRKSGKLMGAGDPY